MGGNVDGMGKGVLCLGSLMVDIICPVTALPRSGEGVVAEGYSMSLGGCAFNTANIIRQMGGFCQLFAPVGNGPYANFVRGELEHRGFDPFNVDTALDNGAAVCMVEPDGERTMLTLPGIERRYAREWCRHFDFSRFSAIEVCGYEVDGAGGNEIIAILEGHPELQVFFAPGPPTAHMERSKIERINALQPIWHLNEMEACSYTGCGSITDAGFAIGRECRNAVIVTAGPKGAYVFDSGRVCHVPTTPIEVVDSIGAGDAHIGALLAMRQRDAGWEEAITFANRVSAAVCGVKGAMLSDEEAAALR